MILSTVVVSSMVAESPAVNAAASSVAVAEVSGFLLIIYTLFSTLYTNPADFSRLLSA